ncbi:MAG: phosphoribosylanthranilate isomerase [Roseivirga sp.]|jgi:phosphoribosylanthranilate isomerase
MALKTFVKVSGINNLSDARYCAGMGVNQVGFEIEEGSPNYVDQQSFKEIKGWLSGVEFVGEINGSVGSIANLVKDYGLDAIQIENMAQLPEALKTGIKVSFYSADIKIAHQAWKESNQQLEYVLFDMTGSNSEEVEELAKEMPIVLASGFDGESVIMVINASIKGISIRGGNEIRPGYKDFDEMADILEALEIDDLA